MYVSTFLRLHYFFPYVVICLELHKKYTNEEKYLLEKALDITLLLNSVLPKNIEKNILKISKIILKHFS